jgi:hypothetical protein
MTSKTTAAKPAYDTSDVNVGMTANPRRTQL